MAQFQIVSSSAVCEFNFFADGAIYRGAVACNGFYKLIATYSDSDRFKACALACSIEQHGQHSIVSVEIDGVRKVWAEIRSLINPVPLVRLDALSPAIADFTVI